MKNYISFLIFLLFVTVSAFSQDKTICLESNLNSFEKTGKFIDLDRISRDCEFTNNEEVFHMIEKLMKVSGLPMNFTVCSLDSITNAFATVDSVGTRYIVYDPVFLSKFQLDSGSLETLSILAHEIGHHLSGHTLFINTEEYRNAYELFCDSQKTTYNKKRCRQEYLKYLKISRGQELQADRFAGYIMYKYGAELSQVESMYKKITTVYDDTGSTHPSLEKRLSAVREGYVLAEKNTKEGKTEINIEEIKGSKIQFDIPNLDRVNRNILIKKIWNSIDNEPLRFISNESKHQTSWHGGSLTSDAINKIRKYTGRVDSYTGFDEDSVYFTPIISFIDLANDQRIKYSPFAAIHIKDGNLLILIFNTTEDYKIVYSAPFQDDKISYKEITTIFIELYRNGLQKVIDEANPKENKK